MAKNFRNKNELSREKTAGDDRNLVLVDDDFQDADFEDKVWLFWKRHGKKTIFAAVALFLAIFGAIVYVQSKNIHEANLFAKFAAAKTPEQKRKFASENVSDPIAGTIFYEFAAENFAAEKFEDAAKDFEEAAKIFANFDEETFAFARSRAEIGAANSLLKAKKTDEAKEIFKKVASTLTSETTMRGQAMFNLAVLALAENDVPAAKMWLNEIDRALPATNFWVSEKRNLIDLEPRLLDVPEEKSE